MENETHTTESSHHHKTPLLRHPLAELSLPPETSGRGCCLVLVAVRVAPVEQKEGVCILANIEWSVLIITLKYRCWQRVTDVPKHAHLMPFHVPWGIWALLTGLSDMTYGKAVALLDQPLEVRQKSKGSSNGARHTCSGTWVIPGGSEDMSFIFCIVWAMCSVAKIDTEDR